MGAGSAKIVDQTEAIYTGATLERLAAASDRLEKDGLISVDIDVAAPTDRLIAMAAEIEARKDTALRELQQKHAFEHAVEHK